ncbi:DoxX family membrane protein [Candidatus Ulvibacter alkanivorans]|uniref:DoxX family membrane protein n=1 Tax=Candidatus Ulvibacter alkanivorans TaxID=2267620 RepID=UPI000DF1E37E|nr:DoxX family membrane protein [Candidatus Ulvibacter alkanivorans]
MKLVFLVLRIGLGLMLLAFGTNKFFWFMPDFDFSAYPQAEHLFKVLRFSWYEPVGKGYLMGLVGLTELMVGLLLVLKKWVPLALIVLVPISVNIVLFHAFVNLPNIGPALLVAIVNGVLIYRHKEKYKPLFK